jgi:tetratricopeptide (TPR) repeat protein
MRYCESCKTEYPDEKKFCRGCGSPLIVKPATAEHLPTLIQCPACGKDVASGKKFCRYCGAAVGSAASALVVDIAASVTPRVPAQIDQFKSAQGDLRKSEPGSMPVLTAAVVAQEAPTEVTKPTTATILEEPIKLTGPKVVPIEPNVSTPPASETVEQAAPTSEFKRPQWLFLVGAVVIALAVCGIAVWYFVVSPEARISRAIDRGDLVTPVGQSAYAIYQRSRADLSVSARTRLREKALGKLLAAAESLVQKRTQGEGLSQPEIQQLTSLYDWAVDLAPGNARAIAGQKYALGMSALLSGRPRAALPLLLESTNHNPNSAPAFNELGRAYVKLNDHYHAAEAYKRAISIDGNWAFPQINLGGVYLHDKQWDLAEQSYLSATRLDTTLATPWYFLGQVYEVRQEHSRAIDAYQQAIRLASTRPSSAFHVDAVQRRIEKLQAKALSSPLAATSPEAVPAAQAAAPPQFTVRLFNCDDGCRLLVNGEIVSTSGFGQDTGPANIGRWLHQGQNQLLLQVINQTGAITYGFQIMRDNNIVFQQVCGQVYVTGCDNNRTMPSGVARQISFVISE